MTLINVNDIFFLKLMLINVKKCQIITGISEEKQPSQIKNSVRKSL